MSTNKSGFSRRMFLGGATAAAGVFALSCGKKGEQAGQAPAAGGAASDVKVTVLDKAPDGPELKAGLVGCGGRGTGAALDFLGAGPNLKIVALGDVFADRVENAAKAIKEKFSQEVAADKCFTGFDAFQKVIDAGVDVVLFATPPHFRPQHFAAAVAAGKHVFLEKPVAVDPIGIKLMIETAGQAKTKNLCVVTGTQRHHQREYMEIYRRVKEGAIGDIVAARAYWDQNKLWHRERDPKWSDMEWMIRDWVNWRWLSGDHIVEQHVHNLDVINWFTGSHPVKAVGMGGRARRVTGDQYDFFSVDFEFENGMHCMSMCRQINDCANNVSEFIVGTKGSTNCADTIYNPDGSIAFQVPKEAKGKPYQQEHIDFVTAIRQSQPLNEAEATAISTMGAIMGRESAYSGAEKTWQEMMDSTLKLGPAEYKLGKMDTKAVIPVPGSAFTPEKKAPEKKK